MLVKPIYALMYMILEEHSNQPWYVPLFRRGTTSDTMILTSLRLELLDTRSVIKIRSPSSRLHATSSNTR